MIESGHAADVNVGLRRCCYILNRARGRNRMETTDQSTRRWSATRQAAEERGAVLPLAFVEMLALSRGTMLAGRTPIGPVWNCLSPAISLAPSGWCSLLDDPASQRSCFSKRCICALFASTCYLRLHHGEGSKISAFFSPSPPPCKAGSLCGHDHDPPSLTQEASGGCSFIFRQLSARYMEHLLCAMT